MKITKEWYFITDNKSCCNDIAKSFGYSHICLSDSLPGLKLKIGLK